MDGKISRGEGKSLFVNAVILKSSTCSQEYQSDFSFAASFTLKGDGCSAPDSDHKAYKEVRSCESSYAYIDKSTLNGCINQVLLTPCNSFREENQFFGMSFTLPTFPACVSAFNTDPLYNYL
ncbi:hypothetical protein [Leptospira sarikeiensis]|uniref:Uncharacterized protein n=1 Tax=Leptospira sarikeiensis TaxID=2484943 RepID=A0A4R9K0T2_9LEPT|nr:hypothetical protein [Leptospira sarikeiensis]TGL57639.1 hypothetical protein EHQ64_19800 [Leptospira sarikeiensis]